MPTDTRPAQPLRAFADELARCGVTDVCTSPGSRNTPLLLALAREPGLRATSHIDERCAGFFALGLAKATGRPVALCCTSGTAAANYLPAIVEAYEARVPLVVLTADRPPELRDAGAGQTIDQVKLFGRNAKWYLEVDDAPGRVEWLRQLACRAVHTARSGRPGPVHLNFAFREPLIPDDAGPGSGRPDGRPWVQWSAPPPAAPDDLLAEVADRPRAIVIAGRMDDPDAGRAVAATWGLPVLADAVSNARTLGALAHYDLFLRDATWAAAHEPELVIRVGDLPTSKPLRQWLAALPNARQVALDPHGAWQDPTASVDRILPISPSSMPPLPPGPEDWLASWRAAEEATIETLTKELATNAISEPLVVARTAVALTDRDTLVVASSMPVRDLEAYSVTKHGPPRILANRGANGIDGTVSTAFGAAAANPDGRTVLLIGDVALAHDIGGLLARRRLGLELTIVLLNNDGGGIFHFLPIADQADAFEEHVATPHGLDFAHAAALYGFDHVLAEDMPAFDAALAAPGATIIEVRTDRDANRKLHARVAEAVRRAL